VQIDGTTQPGYTGKPLITLDGSGAEFDANGLAIEGGSSVIKGLAIGGFGFDGILLRSLGGNLVVGNYLGTDATGSHALTNSHGMEVMSSGNTIGGSAAGAGNLISGNISTGVALVDSNSNTVQGNQIGTDATVSATMGNGTGVFITGSGNSIGGTADGAGNTIAFNIDEGVYVNGGTGNAILHNAIFGNGVVGISLVNGSNKGQPAPTLTSATQSGGQTTVQGTLTGTASATYTLELFAADPNDPSQGQRYLGSVTVMTDASGMATLNFSMALDIAPGEVLTATATDPDGNTSSFSLGVTVT
jgi:hypothetical protein